MIRRRLQVRTAQYRYPGPERLDITIKAGDKTFAPTWQIVSNYKKGILSEKEFVHQYYKLMRKSYQKNKDRWQELLTQEKVVLVCFCRAGGFLP